MAFIGEVVERDLKRLRDSQQQYEGILTRTSKAIKRFMDNEEGLSGFVKRTIYAFRGFSAINKVFLAFKTSGAVYDKTVGNLIKGNSFLGKSFGALSKLKIPNFSEKLAGGVSSGVGALKYLGKMGKNPMSLSERINPILGKGEDNLNKRFDQFNSILSPIKDAILSFDYIGKGKGLVLGTLKLLRVILSKAFNFFIIGILGLIAILAFVKLFWSAAKSFGEGLKESFGGFFQIIKDSFEIVVDSVKTIFGFFMGDTSLGELIFAVLDIAVVFLNLAIQVAVRVIVGLVIGLFKLGMKLGEATLNFFKGLSPNKRIATVVAIGFAIVGFLFGIPIIFPVIILGALFLFGKYLLTRLPKLIGKILPFANGGVVTNSGMQLVGERGPELVSLPKGSRVHSNRDSRKMMGGTQINNYITINARDTSDGEMRRIANKISSMVNNKINRSTSSRTLG
tara:strand:- start:69 stop:1424 length:1356 start_codon:yes stop_codon:yes gene_type:complete